MTVTAVAHANIALVKYWGKRDRALNLPAAGSLSLTLDALATTTTVEFGDFDSDSLELDGAPADAGATARVAQFVDIVRVMSTEHRHARVVSDNNFPTASGLASSASAYAALALAATRAAGLDLSPRELSVLARRGSGSAARSLFGGLVVMQAGIDDDGTDSFAEPLDDLSAPPWPLTMVIAIVAGGKKKKHSSRDAMQHCADTSPLYRAWLDSVPPDIAAARRAIAARDPSALGDVTEGSAMAMHAAALASRPSTVYWRPPTLAAMARVRELRDTGVDAYHTMDAGPHVKVLCVRDDADTIAAAMRHIDGVTDVIVSGAGGAAHVVGEDS